MTAEDADERAQVKFRHLLDINDIDDGAIDSASAQNDIWSLTQFRNLIDDHQDGEQSQSALSAVLIESAVRSMLKSWVQDVDYDFDAATSQSLRTTKKFKSEQHVRQMIDGAIGNASNVGQPLH